MNGRIAHEFEHGRQFDSGEIAFLKDKHGNWVASPTSYDIFDEVKAFKAQQHVSPGDFGSFNRLREFGSAQTDDERAGVLVRLSDNYARAAKQERNNRYPGKAPGELVRSDTGIGVNHQ